MADAGGGVPVSNPPRCSADYRQRNAPCCPATMRCVGASLWQCEVRLRQQRWEPRCTGWRHWMQSDTVSSANTRRCCQTALRSRRFARLRRLSGRLGRRVVVQAHGCVCSGRYARYCLNRLLASCHAGMHASCLEYGTGLSFILGAYLRLSKSIACRYALPAGMILATCHFHSIPGK